MLPSTMTANTLIHPSLTGHAYSSLGDGYRERERIKHKWARWVWMLFAMPSLERAAIIGELRELGQ